MTFFQVDLVMYQPIISPDRERKPLCYFPAHGSVKREIIFFEVLEEIGIKDPDINATPGFCKGRYDPKVLLHLRLPDLEIDRAVIILIVPRADQILKYDPL